MQNQQNYFELFGLEQSFQVDQKNLADNYRQLQRQFHPDRYASASDQEQRIAMQYATLINEAFNCLKTPLLRAEYLLVLVGLEQKDRTVKTDTEFLMQQMSWREELEAAKTAEQLQGLIQQTGSLIEVCEQQFSDSYNSADYTAAQQTIDKLQFVYKFSKELQLRAHSLC